MLDATFDITDIASLEQAVLLTKKNFSELQWWRGHAKNDPSWSLLPGAFRPRQNLGFDDLRKLERRRLNQFILRGSGRLGHRSEPSSDFEWMMLAQHYALPTQLLDWSESPLVALYFAVNDHLDSDGYLYGLSPSLLNRHCAGGNPDYIPIDIHQGLCDFTEWPVQAIAMKAVGYSNDFIKSRYPKYEWDDNSVNLPEMIAIATKESDERIIAQIGRFTIHTSPKSIETINSIIVAKYNSWFLKRFCVPAKYKPYLKDMLERMGYWKWNLFPDLQSLAHGLVESKDL